MPALPGLQDLPPWAAHLCLRVESFLTGVFPESLAGRPVVLAVSGGLDSIALTVILKALESRRPAARYPVPFKASLIIFLKWLLPDRVLDAALRFALGI